MFFVIGGTGFVGKTIVRKLLEAGKSVQVLYRGEPDHPFVRDLRLTWIRGEIRSVESLCRGMEGAEAVIHLAGRLVEPGDDTFEKVHVDGTRNILEAAQRSGVRRLLYMSALGAGPASASRYHRTKWQAEEAVCASPLNATIFRPSLIFGREDVSFNLLAKVISYSPLVPVLGRGQNRLQPVWVEDVADCFIRSLDETASCGKRYSLCGPRSYTFNELTDLILQIKKATRLKLHIPIALLKGLSFLAEQLFPRPPLTRDQLKMLQEDNVCRDNQAGKELKVRFKGLEEVLPLYMNGPSFRENL